MLIIFFTDFDDCASQPCSQICHDKKGGYECTCAEGFILDPRRPGLGICVNGMLSRISSLYWGVCVCVCSHINKNNNNKQHHLLKARFC